MMHNTLNSRIFRMEKRRENKMETEALKEVVFKRNSIICQLREIPFLLPLSPSQIQLDSLAFIESHTEFVSQAKSGDL